MSPDFETILIAVVFGSQVGVLSFFTPYQRRKNHAFMAATYPPSEYPRLYPVSNQEMERRLRLFKPVHFAIGIASIVTLVAGFAYADSPVQYGRWMSWCLLAQILPMYLMTPWMIKVQRAFRAMPPPSVRSAQLRQWRIVDFVAPLWLALGPVLQALTLTCAVLVYAYQPSTLNLAVYSGIISTALLLRMTYVLLTPLKLVRADPYMASEDTFLVRKRRFALLFRGSTLFGAFVTFMLLYNAHLVRFDYGYILIGTSILFQMIGLTLTAAQTQDLHTRNFSVYRPESAAQVSETR